MQVVITTALVAWLLLVGESQATAWYVTSAGAGATNGTSYANAFAGWADINMAGISAGDTLIICGTVSSASKMSFTRAGSAGSPITITGLCPEEGEVATGVLNGLGSATPLLQLSEAGQDASYVDLEDLEITNSGQAAGDSCIKVSSLGGGTGHNTLSRLVIHHCGGENGVYFQKGYPALYDSEIYDVGGDAVGWTVAGINPVISGNHIHDFSTLAIYGDGIACDENTPGDITIVDNVIEFTQYLSVKQAIICGNDGTGTVLIQGNAVSAPRNTESNHGISFTQGKGRILGNTVEGFAGCIALFTGAITTVEISGNLCRDSLYTVFISAVAGTPRYTITNNTGVDVTHGLSAHTTIETASIYQRNNLYALRADSSGYALFVPSGFAVYEGEANVYYPEHTGFISNVICGGSTYSTLAAYQAACTQQDGSSLSADPLFLSTTDARLAVGSPARRAGNPTGFCLDVRGRSCPSDRPHIGAYQSTSGDPAATRSARQ